MTQQCLDAETLAYIPTASLTRLAFEGSVVFPSAYPTLDFGSWSFFDFVSYSTFDPASIGEKVQRSLVNLMRCPAWQQCGPGVHVRLSWNWDEDPPQQLSPLLGALAPLAIKEVKLSIHVPEAALAASAVQQLGGALGSSLKQLTLQDCKLSVDFWQEVSAHLPGLQQLTIGDKGRRVRGLRHG
jgi:hypothetical protein